MTAYRGRVTSINEKGVFVRIPKLDPAVRQGPYARTVGVDLQPGDWVILLQLERDEDLVVIAKVATDSVSARENLIAREPVELYHVTTKQYVDDAIAAALP